MMTQQRDQMQSIETRAKRRLLRTFLDGYPSHTFRGTRAETVSSLLISLEDVSCWALNEVLCAFRDGREAGIVHPTHWPSGPVLSEHARRWDAAIDVLDGSQLAQTLQRLRTMAMDALPVNLDEALAREAHTHARAQVPGTERITQ